MFAPTAAADAAANRLADRLEYATTADPARNYCLWDYTPAAPVEDKFRAINLLLQSFDHAGMPEPAYALLDALREAIGPFRTVFGVKLVPGAAGLGVLRLRPYRAQRVGQPRAGRAGTVCAVCVVCGWRALHPAGG